MHAVIELSKLLHEADRLLERLSKRERYQLREAAQRSAFNECYRRWCEQCRAMLPDDLKIEFDKELASILQVSVSDDSGNGEYYWRLPVDIAAQRKIVASARLRLWDRQSPLPQKVRRSIANVCKDSYRLHTIGDRFIASGCEPHWYVPPFQPFPRSETANLALGWMDGILVYAPERETAILRALCEALLDNERLTPSNRERIDQFLPLLQSPPAIDPLAAYSLHPTVHTIAAPLVAIAHYDEAILKVCIALNNAVQQRASRPDLDGSSLMTQVFARDRPILRCATDPTEQQGWMFLFTGAIQALRNPRAHKLGHATSLAETIEWLTFLSALFRVLESAQITASPQP